MIYVSKKQTLFIAIAVVALILVILFIWSGKEETPPPAAPTQQWGPPTPLPVNDKTMTISDSTEIKKMFEVFRLSAKESRQPLSKFRPVNEQDQLIPLNRVAPEIGLNFSSEINALVDYKDYRIFACDESASADHIGVIMFPLPAGSTSGGPSSVTPVYAMQMWENRILSDTHGFFFPDENFSAETLEKPLEFQTVNTYRVAKITLPSGTQSELVYSASEGPLMISTQAKCLETATGFYFDD